MKTRLVPAILLTLLLALTPLSTVSSEGSQHYAVKIVYGTGLCAVPLHVAKELQFFEAEGLTENVDYTFFASNGANSAELLSTGQADVSFGLVASMLAPLDNGLPAKTVLGIHTGCIQIVGSVQSGIQKLTDLRGKRIGVQQLASSPHIVAQRALANEGVKTTGVDSEVEFVVFPAEDLPLALENGAVDAIAIGDPQATVLIKDGYAVSLFNSATSDLLKDEYCCSLWVRNEVLEKYPAEAAAVVRAIQKASAWVDQNRHLAVDIQMDNGYNPNGSKEKREYAYAAVDTFKYLPSVSGVKEALGRNVKDMKALGLIKETTDPDELTEYGFFQLPGVPDTIEGTITAPVDPYEHTKTPKP